MNFEKHYIEGLIRGSYIDFTKLYDIYAGHLYTFILKLSHSESTAKEIVQETFIKVWTLREQINPELSFRSYLFTIAKNQLLNELRNRLNHPVPIEDIDTDTLPELSENRTERELFLAEFRRALIQAKQKLTPRQRELFELNKEQGLSIPEIVSITSISEQSIRNQISQALIRLRKEMADFYLLFMIFFL